MSTESREVPTLTIDENDMKDLLKFIYKNESLLQEYGAFKILPKKDLKNVLKKTSIKLPVCSTIQQIQKMNRQNLIYSIETKSIDTNNISKENNFINDQTFWLFLPNEFHKEEFSNISYYKNQSLFLKRVQKNQFDFHQLPYQSLLKLYGKQSKNHFSSTLIKAHGPAAIFPLSSNHQNLNELNYHHEGGIRYWYIIPLKERFHLENLLKTFDKNFCIEHNEILIDPLMFDRYNIKYHKIIQNPNEIVILSSGILSQSFTQDEMLSESIHFALPNWFYDGFTRTNSFSCQCHSSGNSNETIFNDDTVCKYIQKYLQSNHNQNEDILSIKSSNDDLMEISNELIDFTKLSEFENDLFLAENFLNENIQSNSLTYEQIQNIFDSSPSTNQSVQHQFHEIDENQDEFLKFSNQNQFIIKKQNMNYEIDFRKILHISNLNNKITKIDLRNSFIGSTKVILKQSRIPPHLNYAFIIHRTNTQAEYNRKRLQNSSLFGLNCQIKYIKNCFDFSNENWNIVIKQIPENVNENDLKNLFFNCQQMKYIPARIIQKSNKNQKILFGYAFLYYENIQHAYDLLRNSHLYQINNQLLKISFYNKI